jgi:hypothetical protein
MAKARPVCLGHRLVDEPVAPIAPRFGAPVVYETAQRQPVDDTVATGEALKAAAL